MNKAEKYSQSVRNIVNYMENHPGQTNIRKGMSGLSRSLATNELANESARSWKSIMSSVQVFHELNGMSGIQAFKQNALSNIKLAQRSMKVLNDWGSVSRILAAEKKAVENLKYLDMLFKPIKSTYTEAEKFDAVAVVRKKVFKEKTFTPTMDRLHDGRNAVNNSILNEYYGIVLNLQEVYDLPEKDFDSIWKDFEQYVEILERDEIVHSQKHNWHYPKRDEVFFRKNSATINLTIDAFYGILDKYGTFNVYSLEMFIFYLLLKFYILILCK